MNPPTASPSANYLAQRAAFDHRKARRGLGQLARAADLHIACDLDRPGRRGVAILCEMPVPPDHPAVLEMHRQPACKIGEGDRPRAAFIISARAQHRPEHLGERGFDFLLPGSEEKRLRSGSQPLGAQIDGIGRNRRRHRFPGLPLRRTRYSAAIAARESQSACQREESQPHDV
jgi:hypothetical protein